MHCINSGATPNDELFYQKMLLPVQSHIFPKINILKPLRALMRLYLSENACTASQPLGFAILTARVSLLYK